MGRHDLTNGSFFKTESCLDIYHLVCIVCGLSQGLEYRSTLNTLCSIQPLKFQVNKCCLMASPWSFIAPFEFKFNCPPNFGPSMLSWRHIFQNLAHNYYLKCLPPTPFGLKLDILSWTMTPSITSQPTHATARPSARRRKPCDMINLHAPPLPHISHSNSFIVTRYLLTTWSAETVLLITSQVVTPPMQGSISSIKIVYKKSLVVYMTIGIVCSTICSSFPWLLRLVICGPSHGNRVINSWW